MAIKLKDSKDIFDIWRLAHKYSCDDFHRMLFHKIRNEDKIRTKDFESKDLIKWSELSRKLSGSDNSIRPNKIPKKYERKVNRLLWILDLWERWANRV
tara:strand:- start:743 stop:1036 length:294 start_codon:yes stop_codon:yes gene_type:complete